MVILTVLHAERYSVSAISWLDLPFRRHHARRRFQASRWVGPWIVTNFGAAACLERACQAQGCGNSQIRGRRPWRALQWRSAETAFGRSFCRSAGVPQAHGPGECAAEGCPGQVLNRSAIAIMVRCGFRRRPPAAMCARPMQAPGDSLKVLCGPVEERYLDRAPAPGASFRQRAQHRPGGRGYTGQLSGKAQGVPLLQGVTQVRLRLGQYPRLCG